MKATWIVTIASCAAFGAIAQDTGSSSYRSFGQLDTNSDGRITTSEASTYDQFNSEFKDSDANGDGWISESEYDTWTRENRGDATTSPSGQSDTTGTTSGSSTTSGSDTASGSDTGSDTEQSTTSPSTTSSSG